MVTITRRLLVSGNVQQVGFRFFIKKLASKLKIKEGSVGNMKDENKVEIYCKCNNKQYEGFLAILNDLKVNSKKPLKPTDITKIDVESIREYEEDSKGFDSGKIKRPFEIFYQDEKDRESERFEVGYLTIQHMQTDMNTHFDHWRDRFDTFGNAVIDLDEKLGDLDEKLGSLDKKVEPLKEINENIGRLTDFLINHEEFFIRNKKSAKTKKK